MIPIEFGNGKGLKITNTLLTTEIINKVETTYNLDINYRHYHFLDRARALELRQKEHSFILFTRGTKYLILITHVNFKKYVLFINRANKDIIFVKTRFDESLYSDTIIEGEVLKVNGKSYILVSDVLLNQKEIVINLPFHQRRKILDEIIDEKYVSDENLEPFTLIKKDFYSYPEMTKVHQELIPSLPFQVNGFLFKCNESSSYDILYIFPEFRKVKSPSEKTNKGKPMEKMKIDIDKTDATFMMRKMDSPDLYELCMFNKVTNKRAKVAYAGVPNLEYSKRFRSWFQDAEKDDEERAFVYVKCHKDEITEKWIPMSKN